MLNFVILRHTLPPHAARPSHWDLMLATDSDGPLWTWELRDEPAVDTVQFAERLADHRRAYLTYEGPVSNDRGHVTRYDEGTLVWREQQEGHLIVELHGNQLVARLTMDRQSDERWLLCFDSLS